jgi:hypothetical protein
MQLTVEKRRDRFASITVGDQAALKQTHAQRWLEANRASLTQPQTELIIEADCTFRRVAAKNKPTNQQAIQSHGFR